MAQTDMALNLCKQQIAGMNRNKNRKGEYAPHKPILLLSIIDLVEVGKTRAKIRIRERKSKRKWQKRMGGSKKEYERRKKMGKCFAGLKELPTFATWRDKTTASCPRSSGNLSQG